MPTGKICETCGQYREYCDYGKHHKTFDGHRKVCNYCAGKSGPKVTKKSSVILRTPTPKSPTSHLVNAVKNHPQFAEELSYFQKTCGNLMLIDSIEQLKQIAELIRLRMEELKIKDQIDQIAGAQNL